jgi:hypothetical protein
MPYFWVYGKGWLEASNSSSWENRHLRSGDRRCTTLHLGYKLILFPQECPHAVSIHGVDLHCVGAILCDGEFQYRDLCQWQGSCLKGLAQTFPPVPVLADSSAGW